MPVAYNSLNCPINSLEGVKRVIIWWPQCFIQFISDVVSPREIGRPVYLVGRCLLLWLALVQGIFSWLSTTRACSVPITYLGGWWATYSSHWRLVVRHWRLLLVNGFYGRRATTHWNSLNVTTDSWIYSNRSLTARPGEYIYSVNDDYGEL